MNSKQLRIDEQAEFAEIHQTILSSLNKEPINTDPGDEQNG